MSEQKSTQKLHQDCLRPNVLVIMRDADYGKAVVAAIREITTFAKHAGTVDEFLDLNCRTPIDLVMVETDVLDPDALEDLRLLRTHLGEGPGTRIVAVSSFAPGAFATLCQTRGADLHMAKSNEPAAMAEELAIELLKCAR